MRTGTIDAPGSKPIASASESPFRERQKRSAATTRRLRQPLKSKVARYFLGHLGEAVYWHEAARAIYGEVNEKTCAQLAQSAYRLRRADNPLRVFPLSGGRYLLSEQELASHRKRIPRKRRKRPPHNRHAAHSEWLPEEDALLRRLGGHATIERITAELGTRFAAHLPEGHRRTYEGVRARLKKLGLPRLRTDAWTVSGVVAAMGVNRLKVQGWIDRGLLVPTTRSGGPGRRNYITRDDLTDLARAVWISLGAMDALDVTVRYLVPVPTRTSPGNAKPVGPSNR